MATMFLRTFDRVIAASTLGVLSMAASPWGGGPVVAQPAEPSPGSTTSLAIQVIQTGGSSGASALVMAGDVDVTESYCAEDPDGDADLGLAWSCSGLPEGDYTLVPVGLGPDDVAVIDCVARPTWGGTTHIETVSVSSEDPSWRCQLWVGPPAIMYVDRDGLGPDWVPSVLLDADGDELECRPDGRIVPNLDSLGPSPDVPAPPETDTLDNWCLAPPGDYEIRPLTTRPGYFYDPVCFPLVPTSAARIDSTGTSRTVAQVSESVPFWECITAAENPTVRVSVSLQGFGPDDVIDGFEDITVVITPTGETAAPPDGTNCAKDGTIGPGLSFRCALPTGRYTLSLGSLPSGVEDPVVVGTDQRSCAITVPENPTETTSCAFSVHRAWPSTEPVPPTTQPLALPETGSASVPLAAVATVLLAVGLVARRAGRRSRRVVGDIGLEPTTPAV